ncbi:20303_t:CDS:2, partial [Funneliformis geosporum]
FNEDDEELERLISLLPKGDLNTQEYIHIKDKAAEGGLTDDEIIDAILNTKLFVPVLEKVSLVEAENAVDKIIRFLYEQAAKFGKVSNELKNLKGLHRRIKVLVGNNLKQGNIQDYFNDNI